MTKHEICRRVGFLEQKLEASANAAERMHLAGDAVDAGAKILTYLSDRGIIPDGNESVAEVFARAFGISCRELKDELRSAMESASAIAQVRWKRRSR